MNKVERSKILRYAKKLKSINYLGGKCKKCGESNISKLTFHHINTYEKNSNILIIKTEDGVI